MKESLTRKLGPLPAWAWLVGLFGVLFFYRRYKGQAAGVGTNLTTTSDVPSDQTQAGSADPVVLDPGQSVYDPNNPWNGVLPAGGSGAGTGGGGTTGGTGSTPSTTGPPPHPTHVKPKHAPKGSIWSGPHKPHPNWRGIGGGWWAPPTKGKGKPKKPRTQPNGKRFGLGRSHPAPSGERGKPKAPSRSSSHSPRVPRKQKGSQTTLPAQLSPKSPVRPRRIGSASVPNRGARIPATPMRTRTGPSRPMAIPQQTQRPIARYPSPARPVQHVPQPRPSRHASPPRSQANMAQPPQRQSRPRPPAPAPRRKR